MDYSLFKTFGNTSGAMPPTALAASFVESDKRQASEAIKFLTATLRGKTPRKSGCVDVATATRGQLISHDGKMLVLTAYFKSKVAPLCKTTVKQAFTSAGYEVVELESTFSSGMEFYIDVSLVPESSRIQKSY